MIVVIAALVGVPTAGVAVGEELPVAAGETVFVGTGGSVTRIHIPQEVRLSSRSTERAVSPYVIVGHFLSTGLVAAEIEGSGPWQGLVLVADGPPPPPGSGGMVDPECTPVVALTRMTSASDLDAFAVFNLGFAEERGDVIVPAGEYRAFLLGDDGEQRVRVRLSGLSGEAVVPIGGQTTGYVNEFQPPRWDAGTGQRAAQSFGRSYDTAQWSFVASGVVAEGEFGSHLGTQWGTCLYLRARAALDEAAFMPGCPSRLVTDGGAVEFTGQFLLATELVLLAAGTEGAGGRAWGWWYAGEGITHSGSSPFLQLDLAG